MSKKKSQEFKSNYNQTVHSGNNPWINQPGVQYCVPDRGTQYNLKNKVSKKPVYQSEYDISALMDKVGPKMPPGVKHMLEQFINIIPAPGSMESPHFKKEMKKKMKSFRTVFKSPYE